MSLSRIDLIIKKIFRGENRTAKANRNILVGFIVKTLSILSNMIMIPMMINYLSPLKYGIWVTLAAIVSWFSFFDIGLGHGLRNKFAEALACKNYKLAREYLSTTYAILFLLVVVVFLVFLAINPFLEWTKILNTEANLENELSLLVVVIFGLFCVRFVVNLISSVLAADQRPAQTDVYKLIGNLLSLLFLVLVIQFSSESLFILGTVISATPVAVLLFASIHLYHNRYQSYRPSIKFVKFKYAKNLIGLGGKFFYSNFSRYYLSNK